MTPVIYPNKFGIFASSTEISKKNFDCICVGPIALVQDQLNVELAKTLHENDIWSAYAEGKQAWKDAGNYFTADELREMDKDESITMSEPHQEILDGNL